MWGGDTKSCTFWFGARGSQDGALKTPETLIPDNLESLLFLEIQNRSKISCRNRFSKLGTWYLQVDEKLLSKSLLWGTRFHLFWRRLSWYFDRPPKCQVSNFENRFRQEIFDRFWISKKQSDSKLSGKTVFGVYNVQKRNARPTFRKCTT